VRAIGSVRLRASLRRGGSDASVAFGTKAIVEST
jgi:hypothetical protein